MPPPRGRHTTTAWSKGGGGGGSGRGRGSGTGDLSGVPPRPASSPPQPVNASPIKSGNNKKQTKGQGQAVVQPKSKGVVRLEKLLKAFHHSSGEAKDPKGGCFCLARDHALSSYTPICRTCGFILCSMNHPQYACPFCSGAILSPQEKSSLVASLEKQIQDILDREEREREKEVQDAKKAAGEFPTLLHSMKGGQSLPKEKEAQHKVLSVKSMTTKGGASKVVVSSRSYSSTPVGSRPASRGPDANKEEEPGEQTRVPHPGREPKYADRVVGPDRPWENLLDKSVTYVPEVSKA